MPHALQSKILGWLPSLQGRKAGCKGGNNSRGAEKSHQCRKYFLQHTTFASERP